MPINTYIVEKLVFKQFDNNNRYTQDSPVYPDVWFEYYRLTQKESEQKQKDQQEDDRIDLILTPHRNYSAAELLKALRENLHTVFGKKYANSNTTIPWQLASTGESVAARLSLDELLRAVLPLTNWWQKYLWGDKKEAAINQAWFKELIGFILTPHDNKKMDEKELQRIRLSYPEVFDANYSGIEKVDRSLPRVIWSISMNRGAKISLFKSVNATKADACQRVFNIDGSGITWAVLDTGIDARHTAFRKINRKTEKPFDNAMESKKNKDIRNKNNSRILATYDFTRFRKLMANLDEIVLRNIEGKATAKKKNAMQEEIIKKILGKTGDNNNKPLTKKEIKDFITDLENALRNGRMLDWTIIAPLLRIPHNKEDYVEPVHAHGTHVAGIIGANWPGGNDDGKDLIGMCPGINLYDIRVLDDEGNGEEFNIMAAIQFIRWLNRQKDMLVIHGINFSLSMQHEVASFACGRTPVCESCQRLVAEGTVVVAAAGNLGQALYQTPEGISEQGFRVVNITDPGNAEAVITVGATHRNKPHTFGVSYFSSRGPTGDGRVKPDIVAPGEKVYSTTPDDTSDRMDGTSMAAPHVSGAAALLIAKHRELIGQPLKVKKVLCESATDLGRERYFQGHGMVDVLRAIQSI